MAVEGAASYAELQREIARLTGELDRRDRELGAAREQQGATDEILGIIASSPTKLQAMLDAIVASVVRLCDANGAVIQRLDGESLTYLAMTGEPGGAAPGSVVPATRSTVS